MYIFASKNPTAIKDILNFLLYLFNSLIFFIAGLIIMDHIQILMKSFLINLLLGAV